MRRILYGLSLLALTLVLTILLISLSNTTQKATSTRNTCESLDSDQLKSERALGIITNNQQLLAIRLPQVGEKNFSPPGGHIEPKEKAEAALVREIQEEIGITVSSDDISLHKTLCTNVPGGVERTQYMTVNSDISSKLNSNSSYEYNWVDSTFINNKTSDTELDQILSLLKADNLIN